MGHWPKIRHISTVAIISLTMLLSWPASATPARTSCRDAIQKKTLRQAVERSWFKIASADLVIQELNTLPANELFSGEVAKRVIHGMTPAHVAQWLDYDPNRFNAFYSRLIKSIDVDVIAAAVKKDDYFFFSAFESDDPWLRFVDPETIDQLVSVLAKVAKKTQSAEPVLSLRYDYDRILQSSRKEDLVTLFRPLVVKSTFLKSMRHIEEMPPAIQEMVAQTWHYSLHTQDQDFITNIRLYDVADENNSTIRPCGACELMMPAFERAVRSKFLDAQSTAAVVVRVGRAPIGLVKNDGDRSFLALKNVRNSRGELVLVKGGVYRPHQDIAPERFLPSINLNDLPVSSRSFYPMKFMSGLSNTVTPAEFKKYIDVLDSLTASLSPRPSRPRPAVPRYLSLWYAAPDKTVHLNSVNNQNLYRILDTDWANVPNPELYLSRLNPKQLLSMLQEKWALIKNPDQYLSQLTYDDFVLLLQSRWSDIRNPDAYLDRLIEYDLGKILANRWDSIKNPQIHFERIQDPRLRDIILRIRQARGF